MRPLALLCVGTVEDPPALPDGRDDLHLVVHDDLVAVVREVTTAQLHALRAEPVDLDAVADLARDHDAVLAAIAATASVVPLRLGTVLDGTAQVAALLADDAAVLRRHVRRLHGQAEWMVTISGAPREASSATDAEEPRSGRDYLLARRAALGRRAEQRTAAGDAGARAREVLGAVATAVVDVGPGTGRVALLVPRARDDELRRAAEDVARTLPDGLRLELSGPWPGYHFTADDDA